MFYFRDNFFISLFDSLLENCLKRQNSEWRVSNMLLGAGLGLCVDDVKAFENFNQFRLV